MILVPNYDSDGEAVKVSQSEFKKDLTLSGQGTRLLRRLNYGWSSHRSLERGSHLSRIAHATTPESRFSAGPGTTFIRQLSKHSSSDAEWQALVDEASNTILDLLPMRADLSELELGPLEPQLADLPTFPEDGEAMDADHDADEGELEDVGTSETDATESADDVRSVALDVESISSLIPSGLTDLVERVKEIVPVGSIEHRDALAHELEEMAASLRIISEKEAEEARLIEDLREANARLRRIAAISKTASRSVH